MTKEEFDAMPALLTTRQAAEACRVCDATIWRWIKAGRIKGVKVGQDWRISKADIGAKLYAIA